MIYFWNRSLLAGMVLLGSTIVADADYQSDIVAAVFAILGGCVKQSKQVQTQSISVPRIFWELVACTLLGFGFHAWCLYKQFEFSRLIWFGCSGVGFCGSSLFQIISDTIGDKIKLIIAAFFAALTSGPKGSKDDPVDKK